MKKETIIVRCDGDGCKNVAEIVDKNSFPEHWYRINQVDSAGRVNGAIGFDLCSLRCVEKWGKARRATDVDENRHEYICDVPGCDKTFDTMQGVTLHKTRAHG